MTERVEDDEVVATVDWLCAQVEQRAAHSDSDSSVTSDSQSDDQSFDGDRAARSLIHYIHERADETKPFINLDEVRKFVFPGSYKYSAKRVVVNALEEGVHYTISKVGRAKKCGRGGSNAEEILLTHEGFRLFCANSHTRGSVHVQMMLMKLYPEVQHLVPDADKKSAVERLAKEASAKISQEPVQKSEHDHVCDAVAEGIGGRREVQNAAGKADVENTTHVFEVKHWNNWMHGVGQVIGYSTATRKRPCLVLFGGEPPEICKRVCVERDIELKAFSTSC